MLNTKKSLSLTLVIALIFHINFASTSSAAPTTVVDLAVGSVCANGPYTSGTYAQLYTVGSTSNISSIRILIGTGSTTYFNTSNVKIYATNALVPGALLATFSPSSISGGYATYTGSLDVTSGSKIWVYPGYTSGNNSWCYGYPAYPDSTVSYSSGWINSNSGIETNRYYTQTNDNGVTWTTAGVSTFVMQIQIIVNGSVADTTPPTFPSADTFNTPENTTSVGTITTSESATITISGGEDQSKFSISRLSDSSTALSFISAPNFEAPTDVGANNTYVVVFRAQDGSLNTGYETVTVTVADVLDTTNFSTFALAGNVTTATYRTPINITAVVTAPSKVTFRINGLIIPGCKNRQTTGATPNATVVCPWKPATRNSATLSALAVPTGAGITGASASFKVVIDSRGGKR